MKKLLLIFLLLGLSWSANNAGAFVENYPSARGQSMGNAFCALADDSSAVFYNPAGLASQRNNINLQNSDILGINFLVLSAKFDYQDQNIGFALINGGIGGIKESKLDLAGDPYFTGKKFSWQGEAYYLSWAAPVIKPLSQPEADSSPYQGEQNIVSINSQVTSISVTELVTVNSLPVIENIGSYGFNLKILKESLYDAQAYGYGLDFGLLYKYDPNINLGFMLENIVRPVLYWNTDNNTKEALPAVVRMSSAIKSGDLIYNLQLNKKDNREAYFSGGAEYKLINLDDFKLGFAGGLEQSKLSLGISVYINSYSFNYAYTNTNDENIGQLSKLTVKYEF